jgi:hypothetical protein
VLPMTELATDDEDGICVNSSNVISNGGRLKYLSGADEGSFPRRSPPGGYSARVKGLDTQVRALES